MFVWDVFISMVLIFTCIATPLRIAFEQLEPSSSAAFIDIVVDLMFLLDMIIIFNKAYFDEKVFKLVSVRS